MSPNTRSARRPTRRRPGIALGVALLATLAARAPAAARAEVITFTGQPVGLLSTFAEGDYTLSPHANSPLIESFGAPAPSLGVLPVVGLNCTTRIVRTDGDAFTFDAATVSIAGNGFALFVGYVDGLQTRTQQVTASASPAVSAFSDPVDELRIVLVRSAPGPLFVDNIQLTFAHDCNTNGVHDDIDLAAGAFDCNTNDVIDGCEALALIEQRTVNLPIPDAGPALTHAITIADPAPVASVAVQIDITHTFDADLVIALAHDGVTVLLADQVGGSSHDFHLTRFTDHAALSIFEGTPPYTGEHRPEQPLSAFDGLPQQGAWTLSVDDDAPMDTGTLIEWSLFLKTTDSTDQNDNGIPDACEPDCDTNGIPDLLDLTAPDCNTNAVPDVCDVGAYVRHRPANRLIPDNGPVLIDEVFVDHPGIVADATLRIDIRHSYDADLNIALAHDGVTVGLASNIGGAFDDYHNTVFSDDAALSILSGSPPYTGEFRPEQPLSALDGLDRHGIWSLRIHDTEGSDTGTLIEWSLSLDSPQSIDCNDNGVPDACEPDCDTNGSPDDCDLARAAPDCNSNGALDACDLAAKNEFVRDTDQLLTDPGTTDITITVPEAGTVTHVAAGVSINHPWNAQLSMELIHNGVTVALSTNNGGVDDHYIDTVFDDDAATPISSGSAPFTGDYQPEQPLAAFSGLDQSGDWTLRVIDNHFPYTGTLHSFSLTIDAFTSSDCNTNDTPDECEPDCNINGIPDDCDLADGAPDCNTNGAPDECDLESVGVHTQDVGLPIPDNETIDSSITLPTAETISRVTVAVDIQHPRDADLSLYLIHDGVTVALSTNNGGAGDHYADTVFADDAGISITAGTPPFTGTYQPEQPLSAFDGLDQSGQWTLRVTDNHFPNFGALRSWKLMVYHAMDPDCDTNGVPDRCDIEAPSHRENATDHPIHDNQSTISTISVGQTAIIDDVTATVNIHHTYDDDLDISLAHDGVTVILSSDNGFTGDNYTGTVFTDSAAGSISAATPPFTGSFRPQQPLSAFDGTSTLGDWSLRVFDDSPGDTGTLLDWSIHFSAHAANDCNTNHSPDGCDVALGAADCDTDGVPDECRIAFESGDCNTNGVLDACDIATGVIDCDTNGVPDACRLASGGHDCNTNDVIDACDIAAGDTDCNTNAIPDDCDLALGAFDCNTNAILDPCDVAAGEPDCNTNARPDPCDLSLAARTNVAGIAFMDFDVVDSPISITSGESVADVNVAVDIEHTFVSDLILKLLHEGVTVELSSDNGVEGDHYANTVFDDDAMTPITAGAPPFTGSFMPEQPLATFDGMPAAGAWTLRITDQFAGDTGTLRSWTIQINASTRADDCNTNGIPDDCESDCDGNGVADDCDLAAGAPDCNTNGVVDGCDNVSLVRRSRAADVPIPGDTVVQSTLNIAEAGIVSSVIVGLDIQHDLDGALRIYLNHESAYSTLSFGYGGIGDNFTGTVFDDDAAASIADGAPPFTGSFRPDTPLSVFDGMDRTGDWRLEIVNDTGFYTGTLRSWSLHVQSPTGADCNTNDIPDDCDAAMGADDCNTNAIPDECEPDSDRNGVIDACDTGCLPGDMNGDAVVDANDTAPFVAVLLNPAAATLDERCAADLNNDGAADALDIQAFITVLASP